MELTNSLRVIHFHVLILASLFPWSDLVIAFQFYLEILSLFLLIFVVVFQGISF